MSPDQPATIVAVHLPREIIASVLPLIHPHLMRFCRKFPADYDLGECLRELLTGQTVGFLAWEPVGQTTLAFAYGRFVQGGDGLRQLRLEMIEGTRLSLWLDAMEQEVMRFAKANACARVRATIRPGWARRLKRVRPLYYIYERDVS